MNDRQAVAEIIARGICAGQRGAGRACFCAGNLKACHAQWLYIDFAVAAVIALERAGYTVEKISDTILAETSL